MQSLDYPQSMKRFGRSDKDSDKDPPASGEDGEVATAADETPDSSNSGARDTVPQLPNISRNSIASHRSSAGPHTPHQRNSTGIGSEPNGSAPPTLVKVHCNLAASFCSFRALCDAENAEVVRTQV